MNEIQLSKILRIPESVLSGLETHMASLTNSSGVIEKLEVDIEKLIEDRLGKIGLSIKSSAQDVVAGLSGKIKEGEDALYDYLKMERDGFDFEKLKALAYEITTETEGFFLKKENAKDILRNRPPEGVLKYLGYNNVEEMLEKEDVVEIFSALRFVEDDKWMHETFEQAYGSFTSEDFERRGIELRVLGDKWHEVAEKFVAKKHHNVSHLKEFGVIFLNPINQTAPGALLRDFALFFHYFHEIAFYSRLFERFAGKEDFAQKLKSFLRGDVPEKDSVEKGEWLIVQRYLWKEDLKDPKLFLPRVNPESLHWHKGENNIIDFGERNPESGLGFWRELDFVGGYFKNGDQERLISFDLEDNAMTYSESQRGEDKEIWYHQQEALWNELFRRYIGQEEMDRLIIENFDKGSIKLT